MKHILLPTDFSDNAHHAIDYAVRMFGVEDATFHIFYTFAIPVVTSEVSYAPIEHYEKEGTQRLQDEIAALRTKYPDIQLAQHLEFGDIPTALDKVQKEHDFYAVVMGTRGSSGLKQVFFGSNTYDLVDNTQLPVFVIPVDCDCHMPSNVVFACDLKPFKNDTVIEPLQNIVKTFDANLTILNVKSDSDTFTMNQEMNHLDVLFENQDINVCFDDSDGVVEAIEGYSKEYPTDLVVALKRKKNFLQDLFGKSVTRDLTFHIHTPLLILHE
ncbi:MAG: universal stress protein [Flavobacteriales bacterium]|nr:universal stress protein [Flavobacteriales bacterium]